LLAQSLVILLPCLVLLAQLRPFLQCPLLYPLSSLGYSVESHDTRGGVFYYFYVVSDYEKLKTVLDSFASNSRDKVDEFADLAFAGLKDIMKKDFGWREFKENRKRSGKAVDLTFYMRHLHLLNTSDGTSQTIEVTSSEETLPAEPTPSESTSTPESDSNPYRKGKGIS